MMIPEKITIDVEPLGDVRWARIERELFAKMPSPAKVPAVPTIRRGAVPWAAALAAALAVVCALAPPRGAARSDLRMRLATTDSTSQFIVGESSLNVAARSLVMVGGDDDRGIDVVLDRGAVTCEVAPRRGRPPFLLDAGGVRVRVIGTRFTVTRQDADVTVDVDHGTVEVFAGGILTVLHDGDHWPTRPAPPPATAPDLRPPPPPSPMPTHSVTPPPPAPPPHVHGRASAMPRTSSAATFAADEAVAMSPSEAQDTTPANEPATTTANQPEPATAPAAAGPTPQQMFEDAARLERTNRAAAAAAYRKVAAGGSAWAPNALFALARLQIDGGDRREGVRLLNSYLARYPQGMNADDARELLRRTR